MHASKKNTDCLLLTPLGATLHIKSEQLHHLDESLKAAPISA